MGKFVQIKAATNNVEYVPVRDIYRIVYAPDHNEYTLVMREGESHAAYPVDVARLLDNDR
ncbi:MAG: hypothetical protein NT024_00435 [Proteobacteria bacterium]|nr:hypothetical protein [Pseudomonadota bacterium]